MYKRDFFFYFLNSYFCFLSFYRYRSLFYFSLLSFLKFVFVLSVFFFPSSLSSLLLVKDVAIFAKADFSSGSSASSYFPGRYSSSANSLSFVSTGARSSSSHAAGSSSESYYHEDSADKNHVKVKQCDQIEIFIVSQLPLNVLSSFPDFAKTEEEDGVKKRVNLQHDEYIDQNDNSKNIDGNKYVQKNPRVVVLNSRTQKIWRVYTSPSERNAEGAPGIFDNINESLGPNNGESNEEIFDQTTHKNLYSPIVDTDMQSATVFKILAPITGIREMFASILMSPIVHVDVDWGLGLVGSYRLSGVEGAWEHHRHVDKHHRPIADLDIQYKRCDVLNHTVHVTVTVFLSGCSPVKFGYEVKCHKLDFLQGVAEGFEVSSEAPVFPMLTSSPVSSSSSYLAASLPIGNFVSNGITNENYSDIKKDLLQIVPKQKKHTDFYVWCRGCSVQITIKNPTVVSDMEVLMPTIKLMEKKKKEGSEGNDDSSANRGSFFVLKDFSVMTDEEKKSFNNIDYNDDYVKHFRLHYNCIKEGHSLVAVEFAFHEYQNVQILLRKICAERDELLTSDSQCWMGILSDDKKVCCAASCGICGGVNCHTRNGGIQNCCGSQILLDNRTCDKNLPPCVMKSQALTLPAYYYRQSEEQFSFVAAFSALLGSLVFWCVVSVIGVYAYLAYDKFAHGSRGIDILPSFSDLFYALSQIMSKVIGFIKKTKRNLSNKNRRGQYMDMISNAFNSNGNRNGGLKNGQPMVVLNNFDIEEDDLTGVGGPSPAIAGAAEGGVAGTGSAGEAGNKKKFTQFSYGSI